MATFDLDDFLPYLLNRAGTRIADAFGREARRQGVTLQMWRVLAALHQKDGQTVGGLARMTSIDVSTLSRLLDQMQKRRLVSRTRGGQDQRSVAIHRSVAGEAVTEKLIPIALAYERQAASGLDSRQVTALKEMLRRLFANMESFEVIKEPARKTRQGRKSASPATMRSGLQRSR